MSEDTSKSLGELRMAWDAMFRRLAELEERVRELERERMTGSIQGLDGEWTVSQLPDYSP